MVRGRLVLPEKSIRVSRRTTPEKHATCQDSECACHFTVSSDPEATTSEHQQPDWNNREYLIAMEKGLGRTTDGGIEGLSMIEDFNPSISGSIKDREAVQRLEEMVANRMGQDLDWELLMDGDNRLE
jgi:hypothetical protein